MTLGTTFLMVVTIYLVLVAYGVVGARRRLAGRALTTATVLMVILPPTLIAAALAALGEAALVRQWGRLFVVMTLAGLVVAIMATTIARRLER